MSERIGLIIISIIMLISLSIIIYNLVIPRFNFKEYFIMVSSMLISFLIIFIIDKNISRVCFFILPCFFVYNKKKKIISSVVIQALAIIIYLASDCIVYKFFTVCLGIKINTYSIIYFCVAGLFSLFAILVSLFLQKLINKKKLNTYYSNKSKYILLIYMIVIIVGVLLCFSIIKGNEDFESSQGLLTIFYVAVMFIILGILVFILNKENKLKNQQMQYKSLKEYTAKLEGLYTDMRKFRHDYINILSSMWGFIDEDDMDGLKDFFENNIQPLNKKMNSNNFKLGLLKNINIPEIKGLLSSKVIKAQELGLDVFIDIIEPIDTIKVDIIEMVRALGIILDNAIEASVSSKEKSMSVGFIKKNNSVIIVVSNSFSGTVPPISKIYKQGFSTKGENRGLGLSNLREMMGKYKNITIDTSIKDNNFFQEITISNN